LYSTQSIAPCDNLPAPQQSIEEIICSGNMVGYDIQLLPTDFFFHGIQDRLLSYDNHTPIGIIANDT
jgi:hypothetical protein